MVAMPHRPLGSGVVSSGFSGMVAMPHRSQLPRPRAPTATTRALVAFVVVVGFLHFPRKRVRDLSRYLLALVSQAPVRPEVSRVFCFRLVLDESS